MATPPCNRSGGRPVPWKPGSGVIGVGERQTMTIMTVWWLLHESEAVLLHHARHAASAGVVDRSRCQLLAELVATLAAGSASLQRMRSISFLTPRTMDQP